MRIAIINCFETYNIRAFQIEKYFMNNGYKVDVYLSDFSHRDKEKVNQNSRYNYVSVPTYKKNLSIRRLYSHHIFSKKIKYALIDKDYDVIYALIPPNSLAKQLSGITDSKVFFDIIDLWPEAMPIKRFEGFPGFKFWQKTRDDYLQKSELVITECKLFGEILRKKNKNLKLKNIYFYGGEIQSIDYSNSPKDKVRFCYIGSINSLLDLDFLSKFLTYVIEKKSIDFHIIGDGEKKETLFKLLEDLKINIIDHGVVFDDEKKANIIKNADFGINFMKATTMVGMTMKSIEYFRFSLPIINNIPHDTWDMIENYEAGINLDINNLEGEIEKVTSFNEEQILAYRKNIQNMYIENFSEIAFKEKMDSIFKGKL